MNGYKDNFKYDIALTFAGEDRATAVRIAELLQERGISVFYDEFEKADLWGKDLYEYLADIYTNQARYCIMLISSHYAKKLWTTHERKSAQARAFRERSEYILPVKLDDTIIPAVSETIGYIDLRETPVEELIDIVFRKLGKSRVSIEPPKSAERPIREVEEIPMPKIRKKFTDRDKDKFLKESFILIKNYFKKALTQLESRHQGIETDFTEIHQYKFLSRIYLQGDARCQCKIWLGETGFTTSILYSESNIDINNDGSMNDFLSLQDDGYQLCFKLSGMWFGYSKSENDCLDMRGAAEYLWKRFVSLLEH